MLHGLWLGIGGWRLRVRDWGLGMSGDEGSGVEGEREREGERGRGRGKEGEREGERGQRAGPWTTPLKAAMVSSSDTNLPGVPVNTSATWNGCQGGGRQPSVTAQAHTATTASVSLLLLSLESRNTVHVKHETSSEPPTRAHAVSAQRSHSGTAAGLGGAGVSNRGGVPRS